jgi:hypothetical protein
LKIDDLLKKSKNQIKEAKFLLCPKNKSLNFENEFEEEQEGEIIKFLDNDDLIFNFSKNIVGLGEHIREKFKNIQDKEKIEEENNQYQEKESSNFYKYISAISNFVIYLLFFIFTIITIISINDVNKKFYEISVIKKLLNLNDNNNNYFFNLEDAKNYIYSILTPFIKNYIIHNENGKEQIPSGNTYKLVSNVRFIFYSSYIEKCNDYFEKYKKENKKSEKKCFNNYYKNIPFYNVNEDLSKYDTNAFIYCLKEIFKEFSGNKIEHDGSLSIEGDMGHYNDKNNLNLFFPVNYLDNSDFIEIYSLIQNFESINNESLKTIIMDLTLYNYNDNLYYYIYFLIERNNNAGILPIKYEIKPFYSNLKKMQNGKGIKVIDTFRLIFGIFLFLISLLEIYLNHFEEKTYTKIIQEKKEDKNESLLNSILNLRVLIDLFLFIFIIISFSNKNKNLYQNLNEIEDTIILDDTYEITNNFEYHKISNDFEYAIIYDSILLILCLFRILTFFSNLNLIKPIYMYIRNSFYRAIPFLCIYIILILIFALYGHLLFGLEHISYSKYSKSFLSCLELSIFHFKKVHNPNSAFIIYESVFIFLFSVLIIFFIVNSFFGMYLDTYRINCLKYNNIYNIKKSLLEKKIYKKKPNGLKKDNQNSYNCYDDII